jgi:Ion channel
MACPLSFSLIGIQLDTRARAGVESEREMGEAPESTEATAVAPPAGQGVLRGRGGAWVGLADRLAGRYGFVLALILIDYVTLSLLSGETATWARVVAQVSLGLTLIVTLIAAQVHSRWLITAAFFVIAGLFALGGAALLRGEFLTNVVYVTGALLVIVTPILILRDVASHAVVTTETVLGAACAYLLFGICFALVYASIGQFMPHGFFGAGNSPTSDYLFFSFMTLTTVGYGNLIPAAPLGQSLAMVEALSGQIYLVVVVARLVSLWGQERSTTIRIGHRRRRSHHDGEHHEA